MREREVQGQVTASQNGVSTSNHQQYHLCLWREVPEDIATYILGNVT